MTGYIMLVIEAAAVQSDSITQHEEDAIGRWNLRTSLLYIQVRYKKHLTRYLMEGHTLRNIGSCWHCNLQQNHFVTPDRVFLKKLFKRQYLLRDSFNHIKPINTQHYLFCQTVITSILDQLQQSFSTCFQIKQIKSYYKQPILKCISCRFLCFIQFES